MLTVVGFDFDVFMSAYLYRVYCVHFCCLRYVCIIRRSHSHTDVITGLVLNSSMCICVSLFTLNVASNNTDWILSESPFHALCCLLYGRISSLMNALEGECFCLREIFTNVNKLFIYTCVFCVCMYVYFCVRCPYSVIFACLLVYVLILLYYFCLFFSNTTM